MNLNLEDEQFQLDGLEFSTIELEEKEHKFTITLNRPERKNAINNVMVRELTWALEYAKQKDSIRVIVLAAKGDVFCAGGDLQQMNERGKKTTLPDKFDQNENQNIALLLARLNKPTIAKIQGPVYAGGLLIICNVSHALAVENAKFCLPEIQRGLWPYQVSAGLCRVMPRRAALDLMMRGKPISAEQAANTGLINEVVSKEHLDKKVDVLASELEEGAPGAMREGLKLLSLIEKMTYEDSLLYLQERLEIALKTDEAKEGIAAFLEKRKPLWK